MLFASEKGAIIEAQYREDRRSMNGAPLEPVTRQFVDALMAAGGPPIYRLSPADARALLAGQQSVPTARPDARIDDATFPVGPKGAVRVRIVRPKNSERVLPVIMHFHGGGWVLGDVNTHDRLIREIAVGVHAAVVFVDFDRSPEAQFPLPVEEAYAATKYVAENGSVFQVDGSRLAVVGDSAGGNMAAAVTLLSKQRGGPKIAFQVLFYPVTDANFETGSYKQFQDGPWLTKSAMEWFWNAYLPDTAARKAIIATPLNATLDQLEANSLVITAESDVLRDEGEAYARKLSEAGVRVTSTRYLGTIHDFVMLNAIADAPAARGAIAQANGSLRSALE
jgi:acetyl esterase